MIKCDLLIKNTVVMTDYETVKTGMDIGIKGERILFVSEKGTEEVQAQKVIRGEGKLFMPGFTDSHMHTGQQLLKGLVLDAKPIIWTRVMLPFESTLTPEKNETFRQNSSSGDDPVRHHLLCGCRQLLYGRGGRGL